MGSAKISKRHSEHRQLILDCVASYGTKHVTAEQVYNAVKAVHKGIGLATVYRNLRQLEETGMVSRTEIGDGAALYELARQEGDHAHHHLICLYCGKVEDLEADLLESIERYVEEKKEFLVEDHRLQIFGKCRECMKRDA